MTYEKHIWKPGPEGGTIVSAQWLNEMEEGIANFEGVVGPRGLPGTNAVANDAAFAQYLAAPDSLTHAAADTEWARREELENLVRVIAAGFASARAIGYGHSFIEIGLWAKMLADELGVDYVNRGVGSTLAEDSAWRMWGTTAAGFTVGSKATLIIQNMINSLRKNGPDPATRRGVEYSLRTMVALASAKALHLVTGNRFTWSSGWMNATTGNSQYPGGAFRATASSGGIGAYVEFTTDTDAKGTHLLSLARKVGLAPALTEIRRMDTDQVILNWDNKDNAAAAIAQSYAPAAIVLDVPRGTRIRVTNLDNGAGAGTTAICGLLERDPDAPNPVVLMKEPKLADWSASTMFPNGSDEAVNYFNSIMDALAVENPNVVAANPEPFWTKANAATMVVADKVHPNELGNEALKNAALSAIVTLVGRAAGRAPSRPTDTGWVDLSAFLSPGITGTIQGRRIGDAVTLVGNLTGTIANAIQVQLAKELPATWRPNLAGVTGSAYYGGAVQNTGIVRVASSGNVNAVQDSGVEKASCFFTASYVI